MRQTGERRNSVSAKAATPHQEFPDAALRTAPGQTLALPDGPAIRRRTARSRTASMAVMHVGAAYARAGALATPALERISSRHTPSMAGTRPSSTPPRYGAGWQCRAIQ